MSAKHHLRCPGDVTRLDGVLAEVRGVEVIEVVIVSQLQHTATQGGGARRVEGPAVRIR